MADTKVQNPGTEQQRTSLERRQENYPRRDAYSFSPFAMMRRLSEEMDRAFSSSFGLTRGFGEHSTWAPTVEVRERNNTLEVLAELPGMNKDDVKVEITDEGIVIQGERKREYENTEGGFHRSERTYGRFYRLIPLPEGAQADQARADFRNGVLEVKVPLPQQQQRTRSRQIPINSM